MKLRASELSKLFNIKLYGQDSVIEHFGLCNRNNLMPNTISYVAKLDYVEDALQNENISAIVCSPDLKSIIEKKGVSILLSEYPEDTFYTIFCYLTTTQKKTISKPILGKNCNIHPSAIIEEGVVLGDDVTIGAFTIIHSNTKIGNNTIIGSHCAIGSNGFQALKGHNGKSYNIHHIGGVTIGSNCYIAEFVNISRGLFDTNVTIEDNVLIDVGCHIAHDCHIGQNSILTANTKMFGSSCIEQNVWMSPGSMIMNRKSVANNCHVAPGAFIITNTEPGETYIGNPAVKESTFINREIKLRKLLKKYGN